jgi:hypothetical protein
MMRGEGTPCVVRRPRPGLWLPWTSRHGRRKRPHPSSRPPPPLRDDSALRFSVLFSSLDASWAGLTPAPSLAPAISLYHQTKVDRTLAPPGSGVDCRYSAFEVLSQLQRCIVGGVLHCIIKRGELNMSITAFERALNQQVGEPGILR